MACRKEANMRGHLTHERNEVGRLARRLACYAPGDARGAKTADELARVKAAVAMNTAALEEHRAECAECSAPPCDSCDVAPSTTRVLFEYPGQPPSPAFNLCASCLEAAQPNDHLRIGAPS